MSRFSLFSALLVIVFTTVLAHAADDIRPAFIKTHCVTCHDKETHEGNLDLTSLKFEPANAENFARWLKIHDRIEAGEMPPAKSERPKPAEITKVVKSLGD